MIREDVVDFGKILSCWQERYGIHGAVEHIPDAAAIPGILAVEGFSEQEHRCLERFRHPARRAAWVAGRLAARRALRSWQQGSTKEGAVDPEILNAPSGAPYFVKRADLHVSISHSGGLAAATVSRRPTGIDIELLEHRPDEFVRGFFSDSERKWIGASEPKRSLRCNIGWTRKEAVSKLLGKGGSIALAALPILEEEAGFHIDSECTSTHAVSLAMDAEP